MRKNKNIVRHVLIIGFAVVFTATTALHLQFDAKDVYADDIIDINTLSFYPNSFSSKKFTGKPITPKITIQNAGYLLIKNQDYTVSYVNNINPGLATIQIVGMFSYGGIKNFSFKIIPKIKKTSIGKIITNKKTVTLEWKKLYGISKYKISYKLKGNKKSKKNKWETVNIPASETKWVTKKLKKGRLYQIKIRGYNRVFKKNYYGEWSKMKASPIILSTGKWISVDLTNQKTYIWKGSKNIKTYSISSGLKKTPTVTGSFNIFSKIKKHDMRGDWDKEKKKWGYISKDVMWTSYFFQDYAFHASPWHNNYGHPMSHGCVNMRMKEAKFLYDFVEKGEKKEKGEKEEKGTPVIVYGSYY